MLQEPDTKPIAETLVERVNELLQASGQTDGWGHPLSSTTPNTLAIDALALRTQALEKAIHEIALEVQKLTTAC